MYVHNDADDGVGVCHGEWCWGMVPGYGTGKGSSAPCDGAQRWVAVIGHSGGARWWGSVVRRGARAPALGHAAGAQRWGTALGYGAGVWRCAMVSFSLCAMLCMMASLTESKIGCQRQDSNRLYNCVHTGRHKCWHQCYVLRQAGRVQRRERRQAPCEQLV